MYHRNILFTDARSHNGVFAYTGVMTQRPVTSAGTGVSFADFMLGYPANVDAIESRHLVGRNGNVLARLHPGRLPVDEQSDRQHGSAVRVHAVADRLPQPGSGLRSDARAGRSSCRATAIRSISRRRRWPMSAIACSAISSRPAARRAFRSSSRRTIRTSGRPVSGLRIVWATGRLFAAGTACSTKPKARAGV